MTNLVLVAIYRMQDALTAMIGQLVRSRILSADESATQVTALVHARDQLITAANHVIASEFKSSTAAITDSASKVDSLAQQIDAIVSTMKDETSIANAIGSAVGMVGSAIGLVAAIG